MPRAILYHERQSGGDWKPVGVFYATTQTLDAKVLPGSAARSAWVAGFGTGKPPYKDGIGLSLERGTWEDWCDYALDSLSNGHDTWMTEVKPEPASAGQSGLEATYARYVLGSSTPPSTSAKPTTEEVPTLSGFRKVRPN